MKLETPRDCRKFLARVANLAYQGTLAPDRAAKIGYVIGILLKAIEVGARPGTDPTVQDAYARMEQERADRLRSDPEYGERESEELEIASRISQPEGFSVPGDDSAPRLAFQFLSGSHGSKK